MNPLRRNLVCAMATCTACAVPAWAAAPRKDASGAAPMLARVYGRDVDPTPYLMSEKYDGVRGLWDGRQMRFRSGRLLNAPAWFTARLPSMALDGELWLGRQRFDAVSALLRSTAPDERSWRELRYMVFELPGASGTFSSRARQIEGIARLADWPQLVAVPQEPVSDRAALQRRLAQTLAQGGEGLMLHRADAPVMQGRSELLLKLKAELDAEATVVAYHTGRGKYAGLLGSLELRTAAGRHFLLGSGLSDAMRRAPPAIGSVVTYRYRELTAHGLPRSASFWRMHLDV